MYATCLFCNQSLGANQALEHFSVGRRLAFDGKRGRLWVVCPHCERWNLSPLETRWEAIDEAERVFRATKTRVASDNIALARLTDGTELVRIGVPPALELAAWRYGDQFGRRRRRAIASGAAIVVTASAPVAAPFIGGTLAFASAMGLGIGGVAGMMYMLKRVRTQPVLSLMQRDGLAVALTQENIARARVLPDANTGAFALAIAHSAAAALPGELRATSGRADAETILTGAQAERALAAIMPRINLDGAGRARIERAVGLINDARSVTDLLRNVDAAKDRMHRSTLLHTFMRGSPPPVLDFDGAGIALGTLPAPLRLALEMSLHQRDEERAMAGELQELERRWREADAIGKIADGMFLPDGVEARVAALPKRAG